MKNIKEIIIHDFNEGDHIMVYDSIKTVSRYRWERYPYYSTEIVTGVPAVVQSFFPDGSLRLRFQGATGISDWGWHPYQCRKIVRREYRKPFWESFKCLFKRRAQVPMMLLNEPSSIGSFTLSPHANPSIKSSPQSKSTFQWWLNLKRKIFRCSSRSYASRLEP